jgi:hypothetical protein
MQQSESRGKLQKVSGGKACSNNKFQPTMRHSAVSRYYRLSGRMSAEFNVELNRFAVVGKSKALASHFLLIT